MSLIQEFFNSLIRNLIGDNNFNDANQNVVKQHTDKLIQNGDIGFPLLTKAWLSVVRDATIMDTEKIFDDADTDFKDQLIKRSEQWPLQIEKILCSPDRCVLFIRRRDCFAKVMSNVIVQGKNYGKTPKELGAYVAIDIDTSNADGLTQYRCTLVKNVLSNLIAYSKYDMAKEAGDNVINVIICHSRSRLMRDGSISEWNNNHSGYMKKQLIVCGSIKNGSRKENISAEDYIRYV